MKELSAYLEKMDTGSITSTEELESLLADCWHEFEGSGAEKMDASKFSRGIKHAYWDPPSLTFEIERHGATVQGSTRAERQGWTLDLREKTAACVTLGYSQPVPRESNLDVRPIAAEIAKLIIQGENDERLSWDKLGNVRIVIGTILPTGSAVKQTLETRRKRFRAALDDLMTAEGWRKMGLNGYGPPAPGG